MEEKKRMMEEKKKTMEEKKKTTGKRKTETDEDDDVLLYSVVTGTKTTLFQFSEMVPSFFFLIIVLMSPAILLKV